MKYDFKLNVLKYDLNNVFYAIKLELNQKDCFQRLVLAYGNEDATSTTVFRWFTRFRRCKHFL